MNNSIKSFNDLNLFGEKVNRNLIFIIVVKYSIDCDFSIETKKREILFQTNLIEKYLIAFQTIFLNLFLRK
jgi:hypothetical protein